MSAIKVIWEGELPKMCFTCPFAMRIGSRASCAVKYNTRKPNNNHKYFIDPAGKPPDWCPLVTYNQAFDWMIFEAKATEYIEKTLTDILEGKTPEYKQRKALKQK